MAEVLANLAQEQDGGPQAMVVLRLNAAQQVLEPLREWSPGGDLAQDVALALDEVEPQRQASLRVGASSTSPTSERWSRPPSGSNTGLM